MREQTNNGRGILSPKNVEQIDNKFNKWTPVHSEAIKRFSLGKENSPVMEKCIRQKGESAAAFGDLGKSCHIADEVNRIIPYPAATVTAEKKCSSLPPMRPVALNHDVTSLDAPVLTLKERKTSQEVLCAYLLTSPPDLRPVPGFSSAMSQNDRVREGVDCDEVFTGIVLGNGATLRKKGIFLTVFTFSFFLEHM